MKKVILALALVATLAVGGFAGCKKNEPCEFCGKTENTKKYDGEILCENCIKLAELGKKIANGDVDALEEAQALQNK